MDMNLLVPRNSRLYMYEAISINERAEVIGNGSLPNGDVHAFLAIPCDENHQRIEGCDYRPVQAYATSSRSRRPPSIQRQTRFLFHLGWHG